MKAQQCNSDPPESCSSRSSTGGLVAVSVCGVDGEQRGTLSVSSAEGCWL